MPGGLLEQLHEQSSLQLIFVHVRCASLCVSLQFMYLYAALHPVF